MIRIVVLNTGPQEWLPIIEALDERGNVRELYRGSHHRTREEAFETACHVLDTSGTGNLAEFKRGRR